jgi:outer membrane protein assembly factor BamB
MYQSLILGILLLAGSASAWNDMLVITTDFATYGGASLVDRDDPWTVDIDHAVISSDAVGRWHDGLYYIVNRGAANLQVLDPSQGYTTVYQVGLGTGRNPQDIVFAADGTAWIPCYDEAVLLEVDPADGAILATYSTAGFADTDGLPETSWVVRRGHLLAMTCQRLDRNNWWQPADTAQLLIFDLTTRTWVDADPAPGIQGVVLDGINPSSKPEPVGTGYEVRVGSAGQYGIDDGGVETVNLLTGQTTGLQVTESQLGGDLLDFVVSSPSRGYAIVSDSSFRTSLVSFDPRDGSGVETIAATTGYDLVDVEFDGTDQLYLCDRSLSGAGVRVFSTQTSAELTSAPLNVGRPPFLVVLPVDQALTAVPEIAPDLLQVAALFPNPANPATRIEFTARPDAQVQLDVMDLRGRRLRRHVVRADSNGQGHWLFNGQDSSGRTLASGTYSILLVSDGISTSHTLSLVR